MAIGTAQFGLDYGIANPQGQLPLSEARRVIEAASRAGIDTLDTAIAYGTSEKCLGGIGVDGWKIVSKLPSFPSENRDTSRWIHGAVTGSLQRLGVNRLYGLLLHRPVQLLELGGNDLYKELLQIRDEGLVAKIGVSIYDPAELTDLTQKYAFDIIQAPCSIIDRRLIDTGWLSRLARQGVEVHVRSVFLQGLLLMTPHARPEQFQPWRSLWETWTQWLSAEGLTAVQACLRYVLTFSEISKVIVGVDNAVQLNEILDACEGKIPNPPDCLNSRDTRLLNPTNWPQL